MAADLDDLLHRASQGDVRARDELFALHRDRLRRMGYRLYLGTPTPEQYARIFHAYAERLGVAAPPAVGFCPFFSFRGGQTITHACDVQVTFFCLSRTNM